MRGLRQLVDVWPETAGAVVIWLVASAGIAAAAPALTDAPPVATAAIVTVVCAALGVLASRVLPAGYGVRLGVAVVIVGQLLDVVLVLAFDGRYPRAGEDGTAGILLYLLAGYAGFLLGTLGVDRSAEVSERRGESATGAEAAGTPHG